MKLKVTNSSCRLLKLERQCNNKLIFEDVYDDEYSVLGGTSGSCLYSLIIYKFD